MGQVRSSTRLWNVHLRKTAPSDRQRPVQPERRVDLASDERHWDAHGDGRSSLGERITGNAER